MDQDPVIQGLEEVLAHLRGEKVLKAEVITPASIEGYRAGMNLAHDCPYPEGSQERRDWQESHDVAMRHYGNF